MAIGEVITGSDLRAIQQYAARNFSTSGYVAPTVFKLKNSMAGYNYYKTRAEAVDKLLYLNNMGGRNVPAAGAIRFVKPGDYETFGINVDFFVHVPFVNKWMAVPYEFMRMYYTKLKFVFRFYDTSGKGPFYSVFDARSFGIAAQKIDKVSTEKLRALDEFHRELQVLKAKHNTLVSFLADLSKKNLSASEQRTFNSGVLLLNNLQNQLRTIKGVDITYGETGAVAGVGVAPVLIWIVVAIVAAGVVSWSVSDILREKEKTSRVNSSYDVQKWVEDQRRQIAADNSIPPAEKQRLYDGLDKMAEGSRENAGAALEPTKGTFGEIGDIFKWGVLGLLGITLVKSLGKNNS